MYAAMVARRSMLSTSRSKAAVVVYSLSRLARSTRDAIDMAERLDRAEETAKQIVANAEAGIVAQRAELDSDRRMLAEQKRSLDARIEAQDAA